MRLCMGGLAYVGGNTEGFKMERLSGCESGPVETEVKLGISVFRRELGGSTALAGCTGLASGSTV